MSNTKLHSTWPWFTLTALFGLVPVLNNKYPVQFFPALSPWWVEVLSVAAGVYCATEAFRRGWARLTRRAEARAFVREAAQDRNIRQAQGPEDAALSSRLVARLVRNAEADLSEIGPDFSLPSLRRLGGVLGLLLEEVEGPEDARVRLGVVGTYLGETFCRERGWKWSFRSDAALGRFSFLVSSLRQGEREEDPYLWAARLLTGEKRVGDLLKETETVKSL